MNISELFIRRPIMTTLVMVGIIIFGLMGYNSLPISDLPNVDYPTIQVSASRPGASPETMASSVARPLEKQFSSISGLDSLNSTSTLGSTQITLQFNLDRSIDDAAQDVEAAISAASGQVPNDLPNPPSYSKVNPADQPILYLYLYSPTLQLSQVDNYAETFLAQKLSTLDGVAQVQVYGSKSMPLAFRWIHRNWQVSRLAWIRCKRQFNKGTSICLPAVFRAITKTSRSRQTVNWRMQQLIDH